MPRFKQFVLTIPPLDEKAWDKEATAAKGIKKQLLILQSKAARLLRRINDFYASPERDTVARPMGAGKLYPLLKNMLALKK